MNTVLADILHTQEVDANDGRRLPLHSHVSPEEGEFLQRIIRELNPTVTLEVGLAYGISALSICDALKIGPETRHIVIDPKQFGSWWEGIGLRNLSKAGYEHIIDFRELPSHLALPQLETEGVKLDFAFIDGWHTFDHTLVDFFLIDRMLKVGGVVAIDDAQWPSIRKACRYIATNRQYRVWECLESGSRWRNTPVRRLLRSARNLSPMRRLLRSEVLEPDSTLRLQPDSRCIAFVKLADDERDCFGHEYF